MTPPRYQEVKAADIPEVTDDDGTHVRLVCGHFWGGSVRSKATEGTGWWPHTTPPAEVDNRSLVLFDRGDEVVVRAGENGIRFLLVSGQPLQEPVAWYGPIVMNTQAELRRAFEELGQGTFLQR